ncbi:MAG: hypothetical protein IJ571_10725 [Ruminococcus sp.]|nr:hypothetical protein [Ruminococcus sp.]
MVRLSEFIGELVSDISEARRFADQNSAYLSQSYHADPFLNGMPVPHYTIEEAELKFPVSVLNVISENRSREFYSTLIVSAVKLKLPRILGARLADMYLKMKKRELTDHLKEKQAESDEAADRSLSENLITISDELRDKYIESAKRITESVSETMSAFLRAANFEVIKLLDIKDEFVRQLKLSLRDELSSYSEEFQPITEDTLNEFSAEIGTAMFFEFKQMSETDRGVFIEAKTGKMNEYGNKDNQMYITLKIKEQDLDLIVDDLNGDKQRFLSLN